MIFLKLFAIFFRIGLFGFGGGLAMLPLIFQSVQEFGVMTSTTYVGFSFAGFPGAVVSTIGVCLPAFAMMMIVSGFIDRFKDSRYVEGAFTGIRPVTVGLIGAAVIFVSETSLVNGDLISLKLFTSGLDYFNFIPIAIFVVTILLTGVFRMKPIRVMIIMGIVGAILCG